MAATAPSLRAMAQPAQRSAVCARGVTGARVVRVPFAPRTVQPGYTAQRTHGIVHAAEVSDVVVVPATFTAPAPLPDAVAPENGITYHDGSDGPAGVSFRVWAPHAQSVTLRIAQDWHRPEAKAPTPPDSDSEDGEPAPELLEPPSLPPIEVGATVDVPLSREYDSWCVRLPEGALEPGTAYMLELIAPDGRVLERRDPYARASDIASKWCIADNPAAHDWETEWELKPFDEYLIYEMHVGSFTPEGTFAEATARLEHIAELGFTCVQLMPLAEFSSAYENWGYNPRLLMSVHGPYGSPEDLRNLVDKAHSLGMSVIVDVVLHHGAVDGNELWEFDGWGPDWNGGIYHEGQPDTEWGRGFAFWKGEVKSMVLDACSMWLRDYRVDGLRFDSANDLPHDVCCHLTHCLHEEFPGKILTAEVTPENPMAVHHLGFDSLWVHSGYFDIIQQHRALGRGHHGGGDWAEGWNLPRLRTVMGLHYGFEKPTQCIKYLLGSHDQVGCRNNGGHYEDYKMVGGRHRYAVDQYGGGRSDAKCCHVARLWYAANIAAAGIPMLFMGTEWAQPGWWNADEWHGLNWEHASDDIGTKMMAATTDINNLRRDYKPLRSGWPNILHEDRPNGVMAFERIDGIERMFCIVNAGQQYWHDGSYGCWVGSGSFVEVFNSQAEEYGGSGITNGTDVIDSYDGKLWLKLPAQCTLVFKAVA